ncbi:uncharacterized protein YhhL (DUF1145 family) [Neobacillus sp. B4I6]
MSTIIYKSALMLSTLEVSVVKSSMDRLVHLKDNEKIKVLLKGLNLSKKQKEKLNKLRTQCLNKAI